MSEENAEQRGSDTPDQTDGVTGGCHTGPEFVRTHPGRTVEAWMEADDALG